MGSIPIALIDLGGACMDRLFVMDSAYLDDKYDIDSKMIHNLLKTYAARNLDVYHVADDISDIDKIKSKYTKQIIPIGGLDFMRKALDYLGASDRALTPIEVPDCLLKFVGRLYSKYTGKELLDMPKEFRENHFIKDIDHLKKFNNLLYLGNDIANMIEPDTNYSVSSIVKFKSEYRVFVHRGEIKAVQNYLGDVLTFPKRDVIVDCVEILSKHMPELKSYTLDIGVRDGLTCVIEVHNFISCGLYGFYDEVLLDMLANGVEYELNYGRKEHG